MSGPTPQDPKMRQRRNTVSTAATLPAEVELIEMPPLPERERWRRWHALTVAWWASVWRSPMASEYLDADIHSLYILADLIDRYWRKPTPALAAEIRLQRQCFGLTPIDRRRLQWEVEKVRRATRQKGPDENVKKPGRAQDPRSFLKAVS